MHGVSGINIKVVSFCRVISALINYSKSLSYKVSRSLSSYLALRLRERRLDI